MKRQFLITLALLLVVVLVLAGCSDTSTTSTSTQVLTTTKTSTATSTTTVQTTTTVAPITLTYATDQPQNHIIELVMQDWFKKLDAATNGRIKVKTFFGGSLIPAPSSFVELKKVQPTWAGCPVSCFHQIFQ